MHVSRQIYGYWFRVLVRSLYFLFYVMRSEIVFREHFLGIVEVRLRNFASSERFE